MLLRAGKRALDCRAEVHDAYNEEIDAAQRRDGVGLLEGQQLVQGRVGPVGAELAVLAARVLEADPRARPRRLRPA